MSRKEEGEGAAETTIRQRVDDWAKALCAKDIDDLMSFYTPDVVSFDVEPPLRYAGIENKRRAWQNFFAAHAGPLTYEVRELSVAAHGELAFVHSLNHVSGKLASGRNSDVWVRWTACFRRTGDTWRIVHDHVSVPADPASGQAAMNLTP